MSVGVVAGLLVGVGGYGGWQWWQGRCEVDLPRPAAELSPRVADEDDLEEWDLSTRLSVDLVDAPLRAGLPRLTLLGVPRFAAGYPQLLDDGSLVIGSHRTWQLSGDSAEALGSEVWADLVLVVDGDTGQVRWSRVQVPPFDPVAVHRDGLLMLRQHDDEALTAVMVDITDGESPACARLRDALERFQIEGRHAPLQAVTTMTDSGHFAAVYHRADIGVVGLAVMEPDFAGEALNIALDTAVDFDVIPWELWGAGGVLVANTGRLDELEVYALSASDGEHSWSTVDDLDGERALAYQVVEVRDEYVMAHAYRGGLSSEVADSQVVALDPQTGQVLWSRPQLIEPVAPLDQAHMRNVQLFGDVVVAVEPDPEQGWLVGYDAATGEQVWRVVEDVNITRGGLYLGAHLPEVGTGEMALLPAVEGLVELDLSTGEMRTVLEGFRVFNVMANERTVVVDFLYEGARRIAVYDRR